MLHDYEERAGRLFHKCRACPYEKELTRENPVVYEHSLQQDTSIQISINQFMKNADVLPRFDNMICKNETCSTRGGPSNIVGLELDATNAIWLYQCAVCDATWKQSARG
jgi:DNA-directed RNA polymerase subunit M/transcription elongation factor TFIIS